MPHVWQKAVLDDVLVERVGADVLFRREHVQLFARHKPQERSFAGTHRAIARHRPIEIAFYLERNLAAVTATLVLHVGSPFSSTMPETLRLEIDSRSITAVHIEQHRDMLVRNVHSGPKFIYRASSPWGGPGDDPRTLLALGGRAACPTSASR